MRHVIIPARYGSSRLPAKPLALIQGKPMIQWVYEKAIAANVDSVVVATDDERIADVVKALGADVFMSDKPHESGTERIAEVVEARGYGSEDIIINFQGDQPFLQSVLVNEVASCLENNPDFPMATLYIPFIDEADIFNPNAVKIVLDKHKRALYFSRATIPWQRDDFAKNPKRIDLSRFHQHIGLYAYRPEFIKQYISLTPSPLENEEMLEQLRVLWHGYSIVAAEASVIPGQEINTKEDLVRANQ